jgi:hypothetical protein
MPDNTLSTLLQIKTKIRRLTRSLSVSQLSEADLEQYINQFLLYDFPEHLRHQNFHTVLTFYTEPFVDTYDTNTTDPSNPLYNFKNKYITVNPPAYVSGYQALWVQSENQLYGIYPKISSIASIGTSGDGATVTFTGGINQSGGTGSYTSLVLPGSVLFESIDINGLGISLIDYPHYSGLAPSNIIGALAPVGWTGSLVGFPFGQINYITGVFTLTFLTAPAQNATINSQCVITQPSIPQTIMFFDGAFKLRPVPDQVYRVDVEAFVRPTELLSNTDQPLLSEMWEYIAYGAAKKVFEDRMDTDSIQQILPEYHKRELLLNRRTVVQQTNQRASSIYTEQSGGAGAYGAGWFSGGGLF